jgi:TRAP-type mannitol/chloroaromatic compound transport system permease small subunit
VELPDTRLSRLIDPLLIRIGEAISWLWLLLMVTIVGNVVLRYAFGEGRVEFEEIQWHIYACGFLLGLAYAYQADSHIRVDVLHERLTVRTRAWIELYGTLLFVLPFIAVILIFGVPFVTASFHMGEVSQAPGGLPLRWLIKAALPIGFGLLLIAAIARLSRVWTLLFLTPEEPRGA